MGVLDRLGRVISSNVNSMLDKVENPDKLADLALEDMDRALRQAKRAATEARGEAKRHEQRSAQLRSEADNWYKRASEALKAGEEALARDALNQRHQLLTEAVGEAEVAKQAATESEEITRQIGVLQAKRDVFAARKGTLVTEAKLRRAGGGPGLAGRLGATGKGPTPLQRYEEIEKKVDVVEAERELDDMLGVGKEAQLEGRFRSLEAGGGNLDDELAALKKRLGGPDDPSRKP